MEILEVKIDKIKPDPKQPRTSIDEIDLREMAQSIVTEGVINPIEVDKNYMIITGERRWRASKIAGLKTVPVKVLTMNKDERFMRQVIENIHHNTMNDWDTANALKKLLCLSPGDRHPKASLTGPGADKGITWLSEKTGKSRAYIDEKLSLLGAPKGFQKAVKTGLISGTYMRALKQCPEVFKDKVEKKIMDGEFRSRDTALRFVTALQREENNPSVIKKLLETDYSKFEGVNVAEEEIAKISPTLSTRIAKSYEPSQELSKIVDDMKAWLIENPKESIGKIHAARVIINLNVLVAMVSKWMKGSGADNLLEDKNE